MKQQTASQTQIQTQPSLSIRGGLLQRKCACGQHTVAGDECAGCQKKRLQRKVSNYAEPETVPPIVHEVLRSPGQPLDAGTRAFMEPRFGYDFSQVQVHTDARAAESARAVNALAYTVGRDVVFGAGRYAPGVDEGRRLLAHELTHTVQQHGVTITGPVTQLTLGRADDLLEVEANKVSRSLLADGSDTNQRDTKIKNLTRVTPKARVQRQIFTPHAAGGGFGGILDRQRRAVAEGRVERRQEEGPGFLGTIGGGLMGEFKEDPTVAMIGVDLGVSLIPILDQISDARDLVAHLYYMIEEKQYNRFMRWVGLVFTLIGLVPEVGSAIKSASKLIIKGVREVISHIADILRPIKRFIPDISDIGSFQRYIARNWEGWFRSGLLHWNRTLNRVSGLARRLPRLTGLRSRILSGIDTIRKLTPTKLHGAFREVRHLIHNTLDGVKQRLRRNRPSSSEQPSLETFGHRPDISRSRRRATSQRSRRRDPSLRPRLRSGRNVARLPVRKFYHSLRRGLAERQQQILELARHDPRQAGHQYQQLIAEDLRAVDVQEMFRRPGRRMDIGNVKEVTIEGWRGPFSTNKLDQLWIDLRDLGRVDLTVPKLSRAAEDQLMRLKAQARQMLGREVSISIRETLP